MGFAGLQSGLHRAVCAGVLFVLPGAVIAAACDVVDTLDRFAASGTPPLGAVCSSYLTSSSTTGASCFWDHPYRSISARNQASALWRTLTKCRDGHLNEPDGRVNHPDSYDLREWAHEGGTYAISVKDKGAQNRTLVFFRIEPGQSPPTD